jgi:hypothetical protein
MATPVWNINTCVEAEWDAESRPLHNVYTWAFSFEVIGLNLALNDRFDFFV